MSTRLLFIPCFVLVFAAGCKGCGRSENDEISAPPSIDALRQEQSDHARLLSRMAARKLDHDKVYPKDADGVVQCGTDADCFILQAEGCKPATLLHTQTISGFGLVQAVRAQYRVLGPDTDKCKVQRDVLAVDARIDQKMAAALKKRGKTDEDIERVESDAIATLTKKNPPRLECSFAGDQALEASVNLAEGRYEPRHWRDACRELGGPAPNVGLPEMEPPPEAEKAAPAASEEPKTGAEAPAPAPATAPAEAPKAATAKKAAEPAKSPKP
jgi:hypothetical protein